VEVTRLYAVIGAKAGGLYSELGRAQGAIAGFASNAASRLTSTGSMLTRRLTLPIVGAGAAAWKLSSDFDSSMRQIAGLVGVPAGEVAQFKKQVLDLAPAVAKSPKELADALFFVTSAGFRGRAAMDVLTASAKASAAGLGETKVVADAVTSAVNAYGPKVLKAGKATDILTAAVREGKLEAASMSPVLGNLLPTASALKISFEDVAGVMAVMSRTGTNAASGATQINAVMSAMLDTSPKVTNALKSVGLSQAKLRDTAKGPGGLIAVMRLIEDRFGGNVEAMRAVFPNLRAFRGVMNALSQDGKVVDSVMAGVANSTGATGKAFSEVAAGDGFKLQQALQRLKVAGIQLGDTLAPVVGQIAGHVATLAQKFDGLSDRNKKLVVGAAAVAAALGPVMWLVGTGIKLVLGLASAVSVLAKGVVLLSKAALLLAANPLGLVIIGLAAIALGLYLAWRNSETFRRIVTQSFETVARVARWTADTVTGAWDWVRRNTTAAWSSVSSAVTGTWGAITSTTRAAVDGVVSGVTGAWNTVDSTTRRLLGAVSSWLRDNWRQALLILFTGLPGLLASAFMGNWGGARDRIQGAFLALRNWIDTSIVDRIVAFWRAMPGAVASAIRAGAGQIKDALTGIFGSLPGAIKKLLGISSPSEVFAEIGRNIVRGVVVGIESQAGALRDKAMSTFKGALGGVGGFIGGLLPGGGGGGSGGSTLSRLLSFAQQLGIAVTSTTGGKHAPGSYHYQGRAIDVAGSFGQMAGFFNAALRAFGGSIKELFFDPMGFYVKNGRRVSGAIGGHSDHVHLALAKGGVFNKAYHGFASLGETASARPEIVTPLRLMRDTFRAELAGHGGGGGPVIVNVNVEGSAITESDLAETIRERLEAFIRANPQLLRQAG
jgi:TP901 family phage tail tape measure protein